MREGKAAERSFRYANEVEEIHARLYRQMMEKLEAKKEERCPVCGVKGERFKRID